MSKKKYFTLLCIYYISINSFSHLKLIRTEQYYKCAIQNIKYRMLLKYYAKYIQQAQLSPGDRAMRRVS